MEFILYIFKVTTSYFSWIFQKLPIKGFITNNGFLSDLTINY